MAYERPPVNVDKFLGKAKNRIYRIGIELEGGWTKIPRGTQVIRDGSVNLQDRPPDVDQLVAIGELPSPPLSFNKEDDTYWIRWLQKFYPQVTNHTCGMHVHMSFDTALRYMRLMTPEYPPTIVEYFGQWAKEEGLNSKHPIWGRLKGKSIYCQHIFDPDNQLRNTQKDHDQRRVGNRYTAINYCFQRTGTVECRLLPMMADVELAERAIQQLLDVTNAYLLATKKKEERIKAGVKDEDGPLLEERREYV